MKNSTGSIRIIGGDWRSRKINVPDVEGLKPTTNRIRETLFNWLMPYIIDSACLDVCAGSGALGFEALSRGAASVDFVEKNEKAANAIADNARALGVQADIDRQSILEVLKNNTLSKSYDIVFVDPPFDLKMHESIFSALIAGKWLKPDAIIYCEKPRFSELVLPKNWYWLKDKRSKNLEFGLLAFYDVMVDSRL